MFLFFTTPAFKCLFFIPMIVVALTYVGYTYNVDRPLPLLTCTETIYTPVNFIHITVLLVSDNRFT